MKLEIKEHSKDADIIEVDSYDAKETFTKLTEKDEMGNRKNDFLVFGENIYSTINIQSIKVVN
ncbi:hypothetical protein [Enterococcus thailandicus]|uniref:hypothetical protein n=1 Tax=Enterococcus TaxID=1350 RepID=UPI0032E52E5D|nr:hypothetical protein [Vibrio parahaemolyticus]